MTLYTHFSSERKKFNFCILYALKHNIILRFPRNLLFILTITNVQNILKKKKNVGKVIILKQ